jgi:uncharacterized protein (DUF2147 family)
MNRLAVALFAVLLMTLGCSSSTEPDAESKKAAEPAAPAANADPLSGKWKGDWGPSEQDRNDVRLDLQLSGTTLTGTINPGEGDIPLTNTSWDPATKAFRMEADAKGRQGPVHYKIEGKVDGTTMTGTWSHETRKGDFKLTKE